MKLNGVIILRISDFRRFFDFNEFWKQKDEFIKLIEDDNIDFFCSTEEEKSNCRSMLRLFKKTKSSSVNDEIAFQQNLAADYDKNIGGKYFLARKEKAMLMVLSNIIFSEKSFEKYASIVEWTKIISGNGAVKNYYEVYESKEFPQTDNPKYPLSAKPIVNKSSNPIKITVGEESKELSGEGYVGNCVVGLFDSDDKCYKILPNIEKNDDVELRIRFNSTTKKTYLEIKQLNSNDTKKVEDVISFYLVKKAFAYVNYNGETVFSDYLKMYDFYNECKGKSGLVIIGNYNGKPELIEKTI